MAKNLPQKFNFELQLQSVKCSHRKCFQHNIRSLACKFVYHVWEGVECVCVPMLNWISYTSVTYIIMVGFYCVGVTPSFRNSDLIGCFYD